VTGLLIGLAIAIPAVWLIVRDQLAQHREDQRRARYAARIAAERQPARRAAWRIIRDTDQGTR
jgi:hypothetical protein